MARINRYTGNRKFKTGKEALAHLSPRELEDLNKTFQLKSLWKDRKADSWSFFCPLCRASRKVPYRSRPGGARQVIQIALTSAIFMLTTWTWFTWKGIVSFVPIWAAFEIYFRTKVRGVVKCPHCAFDPYLYLIDIQRARSEIETHWRGKFAERGIPFPERDRPASFENPVEEAPVAVSDTPESALDAALEKNSKSEQLRQN